MIPHRIGERISDLLLGAVVKEIFKYIPGAKSGSYIYKENTNQL